MTSATAGFKNQNMRTQGVFSDEPIDINYSITGSGPALLLLHGFPQTQAIWHKVALPLSQHFTLVMPDLRGYGASSKPKGGQDHACYSKRAMAQDQVDLMHALGFDRFGLVGHDRGARVSHRLAKDHSQAVSRMMLLDISPTLTMYESTSQAFATSYWHWFFLIQREPVPETLIGGNPEFWLRQHMGSRFAGLNIFSPEVWQAYLRNATDPACVHAMCEDYRASASIDLEHDREDLARGLKLTMPLHLHWGSKGVIERCFSPLEDWRACSNAPVTGSALECGHYIPEEMPLELTQSILRFFGEQ
jgi:haloacetate dehalogenase